MSDVALVSNGFIVVAANQDSVRREGGRSRVFRAATPLSQEPPQSPYELYRPGLLAKFTPT